MKQRNSEFSQTGENKSGTKQCSSGIFLGWSFYKEGFVQKGDSIDESPKRYKLIYNGEFSNFKTLLLIKIQQM